MQLPMAALTPILQPNESRRDITNSPLPRIATVFALCSLATGTAFAATSAPQVNLQAQMGETPVDAQVTALVTGSQTKYVKVTLARPVRGQVDVIFAGPGMDWRQASDGSWETWLRVPAETAEWTFMVDVAAPYRTQQRADQADHGHHRDTGRAGDHGRAPVWLGR